MDYLKRNIEISKKIVNEFKKDERIEGVMNLGGIARGFADIDSDIDIAVFSNKQLENFTLGETIVDGVDIELFNIALSDKTENWSPIQKEAYDEGIIAYDKSGKVNAFLKKTLEFTADDFNHLFAEQAFALAWHGWIYTPYRNKCIKGYNWILPNDLWIKRGEPKNAYFLLNKCVNIFIDLLFIINKKWIPDFKWVLIKSKKLAFLPEDYSKKIDYLLFESTNSSTYPIKMVMFQELIDDAFKHIEAEIPDNLYDFIEK